MMTPWSMLTFSVNLMSALNDRRCHRDYEHQLCRAHDARLSESYSWCNVCVQNKNSAAILARFGPIWTDVGRFDSIWADLGTICADLGLKSHPLAL